MTANELIDAALRSATPVQSLRALTEDLSRNGRTKAEIYGLLETLLLQVRTRPDRREADEDALLDVMDALTGWCHPQAELLPDRPGS